MIVDYLCVVAAFILAMVAAGLVRVLVVEPARVKLRRKSRFGVITDEGDGSPDAGDASPKVKCN